MTPLQQTALDFCRECMDWDPKPSTMFADTLMVLRNGERQAWRFADLNVITETVQGLINEHPRMTWVRLHFDNVEFGFRCEIETLDAAILADVVAPTACEAILTACLESKRKLLKGISHAAE